MRSRLGATVMNSKRPSSTQFASGKTTGKNPNELQQQDVLGLMATHNPHPQILLDQALRVLGFNPSFSDLFGDGPAPFGKSALFSGEQQGFPAKLVEDLVALCRADHPTSQRIQSQDGRWFQVHIQRLEKSAGDPVFFLSLDDVTELVCDLEKAQESEIVYRSFIDHSRGIVFRSTLDFRPYFFHGASQTLTGFAQESFATGAMRWDAIIHPKDRLARLAANEEMAQHCSGEREFEYRIVRSDGDIRWVRELVHNICDAQGKPKWLQGTIFDITQDKLANQALSELQDRFRLAFHTSPDAVNINRLSDGLYVDVNEGFCSLSGFSREEVIGRTDLDLNLWHRLEDRAQLTRMLSEDNIVRNFETIFRLKDGRLHTARLSASLITLGNQKHLISVTRDVQEFKTAEDRLRESEARYRILAEQVSDLISRHDGAGIYLYASAAATRLLGYTPEDLLGKSLFDFVLEEDRDALQRLLSQSPMPLHDRSGQYRIRRRNGRILWFESNLRPITDPAGSVSEWVCVSRDITSRKQAQERQRDLLAKVQQAQKLESLGLLAGGIAHDFNNILVGILGNLDLILDEIEQGSPLHELTEDTEKAAQQAAALTQQMLAFSGKAVFDVRSADLGDIIQDMRNLLDVAVGHNVELILEFGDDVPYIEADVTQMRQVILNLVTNAAEAMGDQFGQITVKTSRGQCGEKPAAVLTVSDLGQGIQENDLDKIFEPYFTTKFTGRGLGLAAVQGIINGHRGNILVHSRPGQGSVFTVTIPASTKAAPPAPSAQIESHQRFQGSGLVLLIDDDEVVLEVGERMFKSMGFSVLSARSGAHGLELLRSATSPVVCAVVDLTMPNMSGEETVQALREINPNLPVLISSGYTSQSLSEPLSNNPLTAFIQKPYRRVTLGDKLRSLLATSTALPPDNNPS